MSECVLNELQATIADGAGNVTYSVYRGESIEGAYLASTPAFQGIWSEGKSHSERRRARGEALWLKLSNSSINSTWSVESITARLTAAGKSAQRAK